MTKQQIIDTLKIENEKLSNELKMLKISEEYKSRFIIPWNIDEKVYLREGKHFLECTINGYKLETDKVQVYFHFENEGYQILDLKDLNGRVFTTIEDVRKYSDENNFFK